ncbi:vicilin-like seed storage protein At2g18540 [Ipomoea triloba]|uniref:vicilin-like seed storage protein At2g18540 n=1 Tax=Ipomoea triloba TaxID=35885 RepID=UPI00125E009F|nr:vicilin-like seed storage protein At2g18540 [Ipomoea triloba]
MIRSTVEYNLSSSARTRSRKIEGKRKVSNKETLIVSLSAVKEAEEEEERQAGCPTPWPYLVKKGERKTTVKTENGEVSTVRISDGIANGWYHIEFITLEPNSVFLPVLLQSDMVFYVHTGSGWISWTDDDKTKKVELRGGDIYRLRPGTLFYIESSLEMERQKLRINALFANAETDLHEPAATGPYTSIRNLILGFDRTVLEAAFGISGEPIEELVSSPDPGAIVHGFSNEKKTTVVVFEFMKAIFGSSNIFQSQSNKKKTKTYNVFSHDPDFENCNGWSTVVSKKQLSALKDLDVSVFMVNLAKSVFFSSTICTLQTLQAKHSSPSAPLIHLHTTQHTIDYAAATIIHNFHLHPFFQLHAPQKNNPQLSSLTSHLEGSKPHVHPSQ